MSLKKFKGSIFAKYFDHNDDTLIGVANNLYDKVKQEGILPDYVDREMQVTRDFFTDPLTLTSDQRFIFENCVEGVDIDVNEFDLGTRHEIRFEYATNNLSAGEILGCIQIQSLAPNSVEIQYDGTLTWTLSLLDDTYYKIKIVRENLSVSLYVDDVLDSTQTLSSNTSIIDTSLLYDTYGRVSNLKVNRDDKTIYWWKLQTQQNEGLDTTDFYSYWYAVCYLTACYIRYAELVLDIESDSLSVRKFLESRGLYLGQLISSTDMENMFVDWVAEFMKRGSKQVYTPKSTVLGRGIRTYVSPDLTIKHIDSFDDINLSTNHIIEFDIEFNGAGNTLLMGCNDSGSQGYGLYINDNATYTVITYATDDFLGSNLIYKQITPPLTRGVVHNIKIQRVEEEVYFYFDQELVANGTLSSNDDYVIPGYTSFPAGNPIFLWFPSGSASYPLIVANLKITYWDLIGKQTLWYKLNEKEGYTYYDVECDPDKVLYVSSSSNASYFHRDEDDFNNLFNQEFTGELLRLIDWVSSDEHIVASLRNSEKGWCLGVSSPMSHGCQKIEQLNKLPEKSFFPNKINDYPICFANSTKENFQIENWAGVGGRKVMKITFTTNFVGISSVFAASLYNQIVSANNYLYPVDPSMDYEISFKSYVDSYSAGQYFEMWFGIYMYNSAISSIQPKDAITGANNSNFIRFYPYGTAAHTNYGLAINQKIVQWKGILHNSSFTPGTGYQKLNCNLGNNLVMLSTAKYVTPVIFIYNKTGANALTLRLWDIAIRPLEFPTGRGHLGVKNLMVNYLKNNSTEFNDTKVNSIIERELLPANSIVKNKFI